ncbi:MAG: hypothetical protein IKM21_01810 [Oscillospiraceae bacterium]|nr:hypothetical protein [Oscillospiraceae bacterium]
MKAYDIYKKTLALMFEREGEDKAFRDNFTALLTSVAAECLPYENSIREACGSEKLASAPEVSDMEQELPMSDELCAVAIPYGVASYFCQDDGEDGRAAMYRERFLIALQNSKKCFFEDITDVYGGEEI